MKWWGLSHNRNPFEIHSCSPLPVPFLRPAPLAPHVAHVTPVRLQHSKGRSCSTATHFWFYSCSQQPQCLHLTSHESRLTRLIKMMMQQRTYDDSTLGPPPRTFTGFKMHFFAFVIA
jgi:hypothetical protein